MKKYRFPAVLPYVFCCLLGAVPAFSQTPPAKPPAASASAPAPVPAPGAAKKGFDYDPTHLGVLPPAPEQPKRALLWEVRSGPHILYLYGTMHVGHRSFFPLPEIVQIALNRADKVAVEADISNVPPAAEVAALTEYRAPDTLERKIPPALFQRLKVALAKFDVPVSAVQSMKPVMAGGLLALLEYQKLGYDLGAGVDAFVIAAARQHGKPVLELESQLQQLKTLDGMSWPLQLAFLENAVTGVENGSSAIEVSDMVRAWQTGDEDLMDRAMTEADKGKAHAGELEDVMLYRGHLAMAEKIESYLSGGDTYLVAVGALHLVGDHGLPALLRSHGLIVTQK